MLHGTDVFISAEIKNNGIVKRQYGKFNQYMAKNHMLIEIGSNGTSSDEAKASVKYVAEILDEYFKQNR